MYSQADVKCLPKKKSPRAIDKRRRGRYVEYLIVPGVGKTHKKGVWKKNKDMSEDEKDACRQLREDTGETGARREQLAYKETIKVNAKSYVDAAARGDTKTIDRLELQYSLSELEKELAESVNFAKKRTDTDIGDWGNEKQSVNIFEDTPLISAIRCHNLTAVHALLRSGLCDPTLQICPNDYISDRYTMYESDKEDAMIVSKNNEKDILANYKKKAAAVRIYMYGCDTFRKGIKAEAAKEAAKMVQKIENATTIVALVDVASSMWPKAAYCSPEQSYGKGKDRAKHTNRMHGVTDEASQMEVTERLRQRLASAIENCLLEPIDEAAIASVIEKANLAEESRREALRNGRNGHTAPSGAGHQHTSIRTWRH
eukprot:scaffold325936_cov52-Attheya_sp.AAC.1